MRYRRKDQNTICVIWDPVRNNIRPRLITMLRNGFLLILVEINFRVLARKTYSVQPESLVVTGSHAAEIYSRIKVVGDIFFASRVMQSVLLSGTMVASLTISRAPSIRLRKTAIVTTVREEIEGGKRRSFLCTQTYYLAQIG